MVRNCGRIAEITVMEVAPVGAKPRTRARGLAVEATTTSTPTVKKRKFEDGELRISSSYIQPRSRTIAVENSVSSPDIKLGNPPAAEDQCLSPSADHDGSVSVYCSSSNGSSDKVDNTIKFVDLEDDSVEVETSTYYSCRERRETTPSSELREESDAMDSATKPSDTESQSRSTETKMPTEEELEEFFKFEQEKQLQKFTQKYNFDFAKDEPLEGRYEWVRLKP